MAKDANSNPVNLPNNWVETDAKRRSPKTLWEQATRERLREKDETDKRINFEELRRAVRVNIEKELSDDHIRERYDTA